MGTAALSDVRSLLSIAISHNMDNVNEITQADLARYMGLREGATAGTNDTDASGSKVMTVSTANHTITYRYTRGGVTIEGVLDVPNQSTTWNVTGVGATASPANNRQQAIAEGLKMDVTRINFT